MKTGYLRLANIGGENGVFTEGITKQSMETLKVQSVSGKEVMVWSLGSGPCFSTLKEIN